MNAPVTPAGGFDDPNLPAGFSPFNVQNLGGTLYVSYAELGAGGDEVQGPGLGVVDAFDTSGNLLRRVVSGSVLNAPWGLALAPAGFGEFGNALLVGNLGDGMINAFDPLSGSLLGTLRDATNSPIVNDGLWGLRFGNGGNGGDPNTLYFAAGIHDEVDGLFGSITAAAVPEPGSGALVLLGMLALGIAARGARSLSRPLRARLEAGAPGPAARAG
jgi:uncharacterized protein (TIGR03118 family)